MPATPPEPPVPTADPGPGGPPVLLTPATYARHEAAVNWVELQTRATVPRAGRSRRPWTSGAYLAKTTTDVTARSGAAYGTGKAQLQQDDGSSLADDADADPVDVKNLDAAAVPSGTYVLLGWALGSWWLVDAATEWVALAVTTSTVTAAVFGGSDGAGTCTVTRSDGSTASVTVGNRATASVATGKNAVLLWVPNKGKYYLLGDC